MIPHSKGGKKCIDNIQLECFRCNRSKGAKVKEISWFKRNAMKRGAKGCKRKNCP